jgi:hypothetical protein
MHSASENPHAAAEYYALGSVEAQRRYGYQIASSLGEEDPMAAMEWVASIPEEQSRERMLTSALSNWGREAPADALQYTLAKYPGRSELIADIFSTWAENDLEAALIEANGLTNQSAREQALAHCYTALARSDPLKALQQANRLTGGIKETALDQIGATWAQESPTDAANWALKSGAGENVMQSVMNTWARESPVEAAQWLQQTRPGKERDIAIESFVTSVVESDPESAAAWGLAIQDEQRRINAIGAVTSRWLQADRKAAAAWLQSAQGIPEETRKRVSQMYGIK